MNPSASTTSRACSGTHENATHAKSDSRASGPHMSQSTNPTRPSSSQTALYGAASLWPITNPGTDTTLPPHGFDPWIEVEDRLVKPAQPPGNLRQGLVAVSPCRPRATTADRLTRQVADNVATNSSAPKGRGAPSKPLSSRWAKTLRTDGAQGPATRRTVPSTTVAPPSKPPSNRRSSTPTRLPDHATPGFRGRTQRHLNAPSCLISCGITGHACSAGVDWRRHPSGRCGPGEQRRFRRGAARSCCRRT